MPVIFLNFPSIVKIYIKKDHNCLLIKRYQFRIYNLLFFTDSTQLLQFALPCLEKYLTNFHISVLEIGTLLQFLRKIYSFCWRVQPGSSFGLLCSIRVLSTRSYSRQVTWDGHSGYSRAYSIIPADSAW